MPEMPEEVKMMIMMREDLKKTPLILLLVLF